MPETRVQLISCFQIVFPDLPEDRIPEASQQTVMSWDSVAAITLVSVIDEQFDIQMDFEVLPELDSFTKILDYVENLTAAKR